LKKNREVVQRADIADVMKQMESGENENSKLSSLMADIDNEFLELDELLK
jgi:hypothetical protein